MLFTHQPLLMIDDLIGDRILIGNLFREEVGRGATAGRMEKRIRSGEKPGSMP